MARRPVDEKIIKLSMDNRDLARKAAESTSLLSKLRDGLNKIPGVNLGKTASEMGQLGDSIKGIDYSNMHQGIDMLNDKFSAFGIMGQEVIRRLTNAVIDMVTGLGKAVWGQMMTAGKQRAQNIERAEFQFKGLGINVEKAMKAAEYATLGTHYGLDEAAVAASQLGASELEAGDDMATALRAISGVAAMTNSSYTDTADIFTTVAGNGKLMTMQMQQMAGRGLNVAATLADSFGVTEAALREMVTRGEVSFEDFYMAMDEAFGEHATSSRDTFEGAMSAMKASVTRIGATIWTPIMEHSRPVLLELMEFFNEIHEAFKPIMTKIEPMMKSAFDGIGNAIKSINLENLGATWMALFNSLVNIGTALGRILGPLSKAFFNLFSFSGTPILNLAQGFEKLTSKLIISKEASESLGKIFGGLSDFIKGLVGKVLELAGSFGSAFPNMSSVVNTFSQGTANALSSMGEWLSGLLSNSSFSGLQRLGDTIKSLTKIFEYHYDKTSSVFKALYEVIKEYLGYLNISFDSITDFIKSTADAIGRILGPVGDLVKDIFSGLEFRHILGGGFLAGIWGLIKKITSSMDGLNGIWKGIKNFIDVLSEKQSGPGVLQNIADSLTSFSDSLKKSVSLGKIITLATALGILAVAMKVLEDLDTAQITRGMSAIAGSMATLSVGMKSLDKVDIGGIGSLKLIAFATAISIMTSSFKKVSDINASGMIKGATALATTTAILVVAMKTMDGVKVGTGPITMIAIAGAIKILVSTLSDIDEVRVEGIVKGLGTIGVMLGEIVIFARLMDGVKIKMSTALAIAAIGGALHIIVSAIKKIDDIRWQGLVKGLGTIGILLGEIAVFAKLTKASKVRVTDAVGITIIAAAMHVFANAIKKIDDIRVEGLVKGLTTIAVVLAEVAVFSKLAKGSGMISAGVGLTIIAAAIKIMVPPLKELGEMRWKDLVKGLGAMAGALAAFVVAANLAKGTMSGSLSIAVMATSLTLLIKPIQELSTMTWGELLSNLGKLAVTLGVVAGGKYIISSAVPMMLAFSGALLAFGAAVALIGGGLALFGTGMVALAGLTATSVAAIISAIEMLLDGLLGLLEKIGELISGIIITASNVIQDSAGAIVDAVLSILIAIMTGIESRLDEFIDLGASIILKLMAGIETHADPLVDQGVSTIIALIEGMTTILNERGPELIAALTGLIGQMLIFLIEAGVEAILIVAGWIPGLEGVVTNIGEGMTSAIRESFGLDEEVDLNIQRADGNLDNARGPMANKSGNLGRAGSDEFRKQFLIDKYGDEKGQELIRAIEKHESGTSGAGKKLGLAGKDGSQSVSWQSAGTALVNGLKIGIGAGEWSIWTTAWNLGKKALAGVKNAINSHSPSKETEKEGVNFADGLALGISKMSSKIVKTAGGVASEAVNATNEFLQAAMVDMDAEVRIKVVLDTSDIDDWDPDSFGGINPDTSFTSRMMDESQPVRRQNDNSLNRNDKDDKHTTEENHYDVHIHATGELPRSTMRRMAVQFRDELDTLDRRDRKGRGEEVVY